MTFNPGLTRRVFMASMIAAASGLLSRVSHADVIQLPVLKRKIPGSGEEIPVVGMGSWITFNVGNDTEARNIRTEVLRTFFELGGSFVDSSPMYGSSEEVIGYCLRQLKYPKQLFSATKVWTPLAFYGKTQIANSGKLWGIKRFDLFQVHNLVSWESHLDTLFQMKADGKLRYVGVTTSHGLRHEELEKIMKAKPIDFVQLTYNVLDREAEARLLPLAQERGIGVIINRPFQRGALFDRYSAKPLPEWSGEIDCSNWAQFFLKFIISHPAVTCAIPATSRVDHMRENMGAAVGKLPDEDMRKKMVQYIESL